MTSMRRLMTLKTKILRKSLK